MNNVLARFGVTQPLARQPLDSPGILHRPQLGLEFSRNLDLSVEFFFQFQFFPAHAAVLVDDRLVPKTDRKDGHQHQQRQDKARQFVPYALTDVHRPSKSWRNLAGKFYV